MDVTLMTEVPLPALRSGRSSYVSSTGAFRLTRKTRSNALESSASTVIGTKVAALFTRTSSLPSLCASVAAIARTSSGSPRLPPTNLPLSSSARAWPASTSSPCIQNSCASAAKSIRDRSANPSSTPGDERHFALQRKKSEHVAIHLGASPRTICCRVSGAAVRHLR